MKTLDETECSRMGNHCYRSTSEVWSRVSVKNKNYPHPIIWTLILLQCLIKIYFKDSNLECIVDSYCSMIMLGTVYD